MSARFTQQVHRVHDTLFSEMHPLTFASILEPQSLGLDHPSQFYEPVKFGVKIAGRIGSPTGIIKVGVPVHANESEWLPKMKERFARMINMPHLKLSSMEFRDVAGRLVEDYPMDQLHRTGTLKLFVNGKQLLMPSVPGIPVEYDLNKEQNIHEWARNTRDALVEPLAKTLAHKTKAQIDTALETNGEVHQLISGELERGHRWQEFLRSHNMNSPDHLSKEVADNIRESLAHEILTHVHSYVAGYAKPIDAHLRAVESHERRLKEASRGHAQLGSVFGNESEDVHAARDGGLELFTRIAEDVAASHAIHTVMVDGVYNRPLRIQGCRWTVEPQRPGVMRTPAAAAGGGVQAVVTTIRMSNPTAALLVGVMENIGTIFDWNVEEAATEITRIMYKYNDLERDLEAAIKANRVSTIRNNSPIGNQYSHIGDENVVYDFFEQRIAKLEPSNEHAILVTILTARHFFADVTKELRAYKNAFFGGNQWSKLIEASRKAMIIYMTLNKKDSEALLKDLEATSRVVQTEIQKSKRTLAKAQETLVQLDAQPNKGSTLYQAGAVVVNAAGTTYNVLRNLAGFIAGAPEAPPPPPVVLVAPKDTMVSGTKRNPETAPVLPAYDSGSKRTSTPKAPSSRAPVLPDRDDEEPTIETLEEGFPSRDDIDNKSIPIGTLTDKFRKAIGKIDVLEQVHIDQLEYFWRTREFRTSAFEMQKDAWEKIATFYNIPSNTVQGYTLIVMAMMKDKYKPTEPSTAPKVVEAKKSTTTTKEEKKVEERRFKASQLVQLVPSEDEIRKLTGGIQTLRKKFETPLFQVSLEDAESIGDEFKARLKLFFETANKKSALEFNKPYLEKIAKAFDLDYSGTADEIRGRIKGLFGMTFTNAAIGEHHPWNAQVHHTLQPVAGSYPTYYNTLHTKQDMSEKASYAGDVQDTYRAYHMFAGVPLSSVPGVRLDSDTERAPPLRYVGDLIGCNSDKKKKSRSKKSMYGESELVGCHNSDSDEEESPRFARAPLRYFIGSKAPAHAALPDLDDESLKGGPVKITSATAAAPAPYRPAHASLPDLEDIFD